MSRGSPDLAQKLELWTKLLLGTKLSMCCCPRVSSPSSLMPSAPPTWWPAVVTQEPPVPTVPTFTVTIKQISRHKLPWTWKGLPWGNVGPAVGLGWSLFHAGEG